MVGIRKDIAAYRFVGYFKKGSAGETVIFLSKGSDVLLVKKGDILLRGVVVLDIREGEITVQAGPDRKAKSLLRDNQPISLQ